MVDNSRYPEMFENGLKENKLLFPKCRSCGKFHWYPLERCPHCLSLDLEWAPTEGIASIFTYSKVEHAFDAVWASEIPYIVALIEFPDAPGIRLTSRITNDTDEELKIGSVVEPVFEFDEDRPNVVFRIRDTNLARESE